jgi:hypothetical protein
MGCLFGVSDRVLAWLARKHPSQNSLYYRRRRGSIQLNRKQPELGLLKVLYSIMCFLKIWFLYYQLIAWGMDFTFVFFLVGVMFLVIVIIRYYIESLT